ncbi:MAG: GNAT family N-acetyltransferase [bacterium]
MNAAGTISVRQATVADSALLARLGATTFLDTYTATNTATDMAAYVAGAFGEDIQRAELSNPRYVALCAERNGAAIGYAMLRRGPAHEGVSGFNPLEIARLYAVQALIGAGVGSALMQRCLDEAASRGHDTIWLAVWEHNPRAIAFYRRWGFQPVGTQEFTLGHDRQSDHVMMRKVAPEA